jgi:tetraacyldisaccharide 4'-kinase
VRAVLAPLGWAFGGAAAARAALYRAGLRRRDSLAGPVISVGNLAVGGRGKTPVVAHVAGLLRDAGVPVAILSRGYGGSYGGGALVVSDGTRVLATAREAGDEPVMLARRLPGVRVAVAHRRADAGREIETRFGPHAFVLDDGFQHLAIARDLDLVCLAPEDLGGRPLPAGDLREFPAALARADVVLMEGGTDGGAVRGVPAIAWSRRAVGFFSLDGAVAAAPRRVLALSGIARPERFAAFLAAAGSAVVAEIRHPDHHPYAAEDVRAAEEAARGAGAEAIATTEKDAVRLPEGAATMPVVVLRIAAVFADEARLRDTVLAAARPAAPAPAARATP